MKLLVKNLQKTGFLAKIAIFWHFLAKKIPDFEFSHGYHYSYTLEDIYEKTLGSFQPKLTTKIEVISQNLQKTGFLAKNCHFLTLFGQKNPQFWIFPWVPLLTHASKHLGEDFRKFSAKTNDKNWSYKPKTFKKLDFWQKWPFFDSFWPKMANFWIFFKNPLGTFFYTPKALPNCKVSEKTNVGIPRYPVMDRQTNRQTNRRTDNSESLGLNRLCRETKKLK